MSGSGETILLRQDNALTEVRLLFMINMSKSIDKI